jgi:hypothetical protein
VEYGDFYGSEYGGPAPFESNHARVAVEELPSISQTDGMVKMTTTLAEGWQIIDNALSNAMPYLLLDYERANGVWLDVIGEILNVPRDTRDDAYYRRVLAAYALAVYPRRRTTDGLLQALIALIGDESGVSFEPAYPKGFVVELDGLDSDAVLTWDAIKILNLGTPATYRRQVVVNPIGALLGDDATGTVVIDDPKLCDDATGTVVIADAGIMAWVY